jgi:cytoskeletal protein CcmA (bactofilin family)
MHKAMAMFEKHKTGKQNTAVTQEPKVSQQAPTMGATAPAATTKVALIGQGISIAGDVKAESSLKVEGRIEGRGIACTQDVEIAETGYVTANIMAKVVKVSGVVSGDVGGSEKVLITRTGRMQGNIIAPRVQLEDGALFRGSIDMNPAEPAVVEKPTAVKRAATEKSEKAATAAPPAQSKTATAGTARKEPGLNLKSG